MRVHGSLMLCGWSHCLTAVIWLQHCGNGVAETASPPFPCHLKTEWGKEEKKGCEESLYALNLLFSFFSGTLCLFQMEGVQRRAVASKEEE